jgi:hypothetical protein
MRESESQSTAIQPIDDLEGAYIKNLIALIKRRKKSREMSVLLVFGSLS